MEEIKINNPEKFESIYEIISPLVGVVGRQYGRRGNVMWTPKDKNNSSGNIVGYSAEVFENKEFFKRNEQLRKS